MSTVTRSMAAGAALLTALAMASAPGAHATTGTQESVQVIGATFTKARELAVTWSYSCTTASTALYAGGSFSSANGSSAPRTFDFVFPVNCADPDAPRGGVLTTETKWKSNEFRAGKWVTVSVWLTDAAGATVIADTTSIWVDPGKA